MALSWKDFSPFGLLNRAVGAVMMCIHLNVVSIDGAVVLKRRNPFGRRVTPLANWFFRTCHVPISFPTEVRDWQRSEVQCFRMLNPSFRAFSLGTDAVWESRLPGESLWVHLRRGTLTPVMLTAAAVEFRRAHHLWSYFYRGPWSHGDAAMRNVLIDPSTRRARLIDFELQHNPALPAPTRHADDIMAFLLDLVGYVPSRRWLAYSLNFLRTYDDPAVNAEVFKRLSIPTGTAWFWWKIRTNFVSEKKIARRLEKLRRALLHGALNLAAKTPAPASLADANPPCYPPLHLAV